MSWSWFDNFCKMSARLCVSFCKINILLQMSIQKLKHRFHESLCLVALWSKLVSANFWWKSVMKWHCCYVLSRIFGILISQLLLHGIAHFFKWDIYHMKQHWFSFCGRSSQWELIQNFSTVFVTIISRLLLHRIASN